MAAWDSIPEAERPVPAAADGGLRRLRRARRRAGRQGDRRARSPRHARQHHRHLHLRRQRRQRRRPERHHQRAAGAERHPQHGRAAARGARQARRPGRAGQRPRPTTCTTPAGPGRATRRSSTPSWSPRTSAARATRWSSPGRRASSPTRRRARSSTTSTTSRRRIYEIVGIKPPKVVDGFTQDPIDGVSLAYTFADAKAPGRKKVQYFDNNGSRGDLPGRLVSPPPSARSCPGCPARRGWPTWDSAKDVWELYDIRSDFSQADDLAAKDPKRLASMQKAFDAAGEGEPGLSRSAPASGCACIPRTASRRPTRAGSSTPRPPACPSSPRPAWAARAAP